MSGHKSEVGVLPPRHPSHAGKAVHLSVEALKEYDRRMGHSSASGEKSLSSMKTDKSPSSMSSLYGITLSLRALQVTKRLSRSVYLTKAQEKNAKTQNEQREERQVENTYKTEPDAESRFCAEKVEEIIEDTLTKHLKDKKYNAAEGSRLSVILANTIKDRVKKLNMPRYKIVTHVFIGEKSKHGVLMSSRCLWDTSDDNFATAKYETSTMYAIATVYGVYFE